VAIIVRDRPACVAAFLTIASCATCIPLDHTIKEESLHSTLGDVRVDAVFVENDLDIKRMLSPTLRSNVRVFTLRPERNGPAGAFSLHDGDHQKTACAGPATPNDIATILLTSGSTARPKAVPFRHQMMTDAARALGSFLNLSTEDRCLNFMPLHHLHALQNCILVPMYFGGASIVTPEFDGGRFFDWLDECAPTWYTASHVYHRAIVRNAPKHPEKIGRSNLRLIRSGSAAMPASLALELESIFGAPFTIGYGVTETNNLTSTPFPPAERDLETVGRPLCNDIAFLDSKGHVSDSIREGEIVVRGPTVMPGYDGDPDATERAFVDGWFRTGDLGVLDDRGFLKVVGRVKEIINRGGESIAPSYIESIIERHMDVSEAVCFAIPHPSLGEDIAAAVRLKQVTSSEPIHISSITAFVQARLPSYMCPRRIFVVDDIPKSAVGKPMRRALAEKLRPIWESSGSIDTKSSKGSTSEGLEVALVRMLNSLTGTNVKVDDDLFEIGVDSLALMELLTAIETKFGVTLIDQLPPNGVTINYLAYAISLEKGVKSESVPKLAPNDVVATTSHRAAQKNPTVATRLAAIGRSLLGRRHRKTR